MPLQPMIANWTSWDLLLVLMSSLKKVSPSFGTMPSNSRQLAAKNKWSIELWQSMSNCCHSKLSSWDRAALVSHSMAYANSSMQSWEHRLVKASRSVARCDLVAISLMCMMTLLRKAPKSSTCNPIRLCQTSSSNCQRTVAGFPPTTLWITTGRTSLASWRPRLRN